MRFFGVTVTVGEEEEEEVAILPVVACLLNAWSLNACLLKSPKAFLFLRWLLVKEFDIGLGLLLIVVEETNANDVADARRRSSASVIRIGGVIGIGWMKLVGCRVEGGWGRR